MTQRKTIKTDGYTMVKVFVETSTPRLFNIKLGPTSLSSWGEPRTSSLSVEEATNLRDELNTFLDNQPKVPTHKGKELLTTEDQIEGLLDTNASDLFAKAMEIAEYRRLTGQH